VHLEKKGIRARGIVLNLAGAGSQELREVYEGYEEKPRAAFIATLRVRGERSALDREGTKVKDEFP